MEPGSRLGKMPWADQEGGRAHGDGRRPTGVSRQARFRRVTGRALAGQRVGLGAMGGRELGEERATDQGLGTTATGLEAKELGVRRAEASIRRQEGLL